MPLKQIGDNEIIGMIFVGKDKTIVDEGLNQIVFKSLGIIYLDGIYPY